MTLLVDVGNSRIKWARDEGTELHDVRAAAWDGVLTPCLDRNWAGRMQPNRVMVASVAGEAVERELRDWLRRHWRLEPEYACAAAEGFGIRNRYAQPDRLGADRWAALIGAHHDFPGAVCIVDCGTALTLGALTASGEFVGGAILPGLTSARRCLVERTHGIGAVDGSDGSAIARTTADAVAAGTAVGLAGAIERIASEYRAVLGSDMRTILTGGDASALQRHLRLDAVCVPELVLRGLAVIARASA